MNEFENYIQKAEGMIQRDKKRDLLFRGMEAMWHNRWELPGSLRSMGWIHKVVNSDPHDALRAGTRVLSSTAPRINLQVAGWGEEKASDIENLERILLWLFRQANRRNQSEILRDIVLSALLYDEIAAQVVYLPNQMTGSGAGSHSQAYGPFAILVRNPRQVHVHYADWLPESVLFMYTCSGEEIFHEFGDQMQEQDILLKDDLSDPHQCFQVFDFTDREMRVIWCVEQGSGAGNEPQLILMEPHGLSFLPWVVKSGGSTLSDAPEDQRMPLLSSIYRSGQWETLNLLETLLTSEVIAYSAAPRLAVEGPSDHISVDYGDPGRLAHIPPGHNISAMEPPALDESLRLIADRLISGINKSTVPKVLQSGEFPSGIAYATLNLATQSGVKALIPYKELAEFALAEVFSLMLHWAHACGAELIGLGVLKQEKGRTRSFDARLVDPARVYIDVELTADVPFDRLSRVNAAAIAVKELGYSRERALEQIGETDPAEILQQAQEEKKRLAVIKDG